jgi:hypothetical protein
VVHVYNPNTQEEKVGRRMASWRPAWAVRSCLKKQTTKRYKAPKAYPMYSIQAVEINHSHSPSLGYLRVLTTVQFSLFS